ncbi:MAG: endonuclease/exonuclease/phosphatase family protein [Candidatus Cloacimonetes bacterium]|nr:endonuclease/exonuclease/phosphatase family protein [Candidatus Cloacimonadota bacterium]
MKIISYNILRGGQFEAGNRLGQILAFLKSEELDIICLNECDYFQANHNAILRAFEQELGMRSVCHATPSGTCLVLLFRDELQLKNVSSFDRFLFHGMIVADLVYKTCDFRLILTHLNPYSAELRLMESQILAQMALRHERVLIAGDFNSISPEFSVDFTQFKPTFQARSTHADGTADCRALTNLFRQGYYDLWSKFHTVEDEKIQGSYPTPLGDKNIQYPHPVRIDFILGSQNFLQACTRCDIVQNEGLSQTSDHYPVLAEFAL